VRRLIEEPHAFVGLGGRSEDHEQYAAEYSPFHADFLSLHCAIVIEMAVRVENIPRNKKGTALNRACATAFALLMRRMDWRINRRILIVHSHELGMENLVDLFFRYIIEHQFSAVVTLRDCEVIHDNRHDLPLMGALALIRDDVSANFLVPAPWAMPRKRAAALVGLSCRCQRFRHREFSQHESWDRSDRRPAGSSRRKGGGSQP
jgi:hypothetical protein